MLTSIITTVRHNIGDDFVREGILDLMKAARPRLETDRIELIHKHSPLTSFYGFEAMRNLRISRLIEPALRFIGAKDRIKGADVLVQSGAPVYWCHPGGSHCSDNEWFGPLVRKNFLPDRRNRKFLNIAGGSCQKYHSDGSELHECDKCRNYIQEFFDACDLTVLRDELARKMLNQAGRDAVVLPCTSIFARDHFKIKPRAGEYIVLNFIDNGGPYVFGQTIDKEKWRSRFRKIADLVTSLGHVVVACHSQEELNVAKILVPELDKFLVTNDHLAYIKFYAAARFGIVNRVHAAFMMASLGKPVAVVGTDSRSLMIREMNLPSYYVEDIDDIESLIMSVADQELTYRETSSSIRRQAREDYVARLSIVL